MQSRKDSDNRDRYPIVLLKKPKKTNKSDLLQVLEAYYETSNSKYLAKLWKRKWKHFLHPEKERKIIL